jgi:Undecaprenyl-phosphate glucose phosphotransferase
MVIQDPALTHNGHNSDRSPRLGKMGRIGFSITQIAADAICLSSLSFVSLKWVICLQTTTGILPAYLYLMVTGATNVVMILSFAHSGMYNVFDCTLSRVGMLHATARRVAEVILLLTGCLFVLKLSDQFSRLWLITWGTTSMAGLCALRMVAAHEAQRLMQNGRLTKNIAIVGASEPGLKLAAQLGQEHPGIHLVGLFDQLQLLTQCQMRRIGALAGGLVVLELEALDELLCRGRVDEVIIAFPLHSPAKILELARRFHPYPVSLRVLAPEGYQQFRVLDSLRYGEIMTFCVMSQPLDDVAVVIKWLEDQIIASLCLLFALPLMLAIAGIIKLDTKGPVLFKQKRLGVNNRPFDLFKFRTMYDEHADPFGHQLTQAGDLRITRVGRFLRKSSLDELPQLINVLRGEMSLVGPRPHPLEASAAGVAYKRAVREYLVRHRVKPGMTGWAQVNGWRGETKTIEQIRRRVEHDVYYIEHWSLTFDLMILGRTAFTVLSCDNAI